MAIVIVCAGGTVALIVIGAIQLDPDEREQLWLENLFQILAAAFVFMALEVQPLRMMWTYWYATGNVERLSEAFPYYSAHPRRVLLVITLLQLNCFATYVNVGMMWGWAANFRDRPGAVVGIFVGVAIISGIMAGALDLLALRRLERESATAPNPPIQPPVVARQCGVVPIVLCIYFLATVLACCAASLRYWAEAGNASGTALARLWPDFQLPGDRAAINWEVGLFQWCMSSTGITERRSIYVPNLAIYDSCWRVYSAVRAFAVLTIFFAAGTAWLMAIVFFHKAAFSQYFTAQATGLAACALSTLTWSLWFTLVDDESCFAAFFGDSPTTSSSASWIIVCIGLPHAVHSLFKERDLSSSDTTDWDSSSPPDITTPAPSISLERSSGQSPLGFHMSYTPSARIGTFAFPISWTGTHPHHLTSPHLPPPWPLR
eukprot:NODE_1517_length_1476_cov_17.169014_g1439_i0.p1 GENE.NODE_1517_length_1476_cov_17.169014_g1439_i0~~NODE_1517_length_1476_cov_17.169014_g1439_i0.p1  ORF type:complete len:432 (-),score=72.56 NODE_1517_length_1476_cov_17.169014_g1439_i0:118-1413(-)